MSIEAMTWVFDLRGENAPRLGTRLVLLALADNAGRAEHYDDATVAWPAVATIAEKAQVSKRQAQYALEWLRDHRLISAIDTSAKGTVIYRLHLERGAESAPVQDLQGAAHCMGGVQPTAPESSVEPPVEEVPSSRSSDLPVSRETDGDVDKAPPIPAAPPKPETRYILPSTPGAKEAPPLCLQLARLMRANDPKAKLPDAFTDDAGPFVFRLTRRSATPWLDAMRLLIDRDGRDSREVAVVLDWCQRDDFWKGNILSAPKFREQYPKLRAAWQRATSWRGIAGEPQSSRGQIARLAGSYGNGGAPRGTPDDLRRRTGG